MQQDCSVFDAVVSFNTLHWVTNQEDALKNLSALLKPGGRMTLQLFPPLKCQGPLIKPIQQIMESDGWRCHFETFEMPTQLDIADREAYSHLVSSCGFTVSESTTVPKSFDSTRDQMIDGICTWLPHARHLPESLRRPFVTEVVDIILTNTGQAGKESITSRMYYWEIEAIKS